MQKIIGLLDLDYFFAQCEIVRNPSIRGKPIAIIVPTIRENTGAVATANYEARKLKIKSGMSLSLVKKIANKETIFINADKEYYKEMSQKVFEVLDFFCDKVEQVSIDEAYFDLTNPEGFEKAIDICKKIKDRIRAETGLTCSIGVSINKLLAKMASNEKKPDGFFVVEKKDVNSFLLKKKVKELHGVGPKSEKIIQNEGVLIVKELQSISEKKLVELFGEVRGKRFFDFARGKDDREINPNREKQQVSRMMTLKKDSLQFDEIKENLKFMSELVFSEVKKMKKKFKTVSLIIVNSHFEIITKSKSNTDPVLSSLELFEIESELLKSFLGQAIRPVRRIGVRVSNFDEDEGVQKKLFEFK